MWNCYQWVDHCGRIHLNCYQWVDHCGGIHLEGLSICSKSFSPTHSDLLYFPVCGSSAASASLETFSRKRVKLLERKKSKKLKHPFKNWISAAVSLSSCIPKALDRQAMWRHLVLHGLAQSKQSGLAQACTRQAHTALDGATGLV